MVCPIVPHKKRDKWDKVGQIYPIPYYFSMTDRELIEKLSTRKRFAATFWRELAAARKANPMVSRAEVFNRLEDLYEDAFGEELWTYDTFRHSRQFREECGTD